MAERLACDLAAQGLVIISGMARGVDTASHRGAISAKGKTQAVFGPASMSSIPKRTRASPNRFSRWAERSFPNFR
jgi:DNA processing protein